MYLVHFTTTILVVVTISFFPILLFKYTADFHIWTGEHNHSFLWEIKYFFTVYCQVRLPIQILPRSSAGNIGDFERFVPYHPQAMLIFRLAQFLLHLPSFPNATISFLSWTDLSRPQYHLSPSLCKLPRSHCSKVMRENILLIKHSIRSMSSDVHLLSQE